MYLIIFTLTAREWILIKDRHLLRREEYFNSVKTLINLLK